MIDLVLSHTSDQHPPWFAESRVSRDNARANWYVWADAKPDGTPPNNWLSIFGGSAWHWDSRRRQYYLHNFLTSQPDLNFHEPAVQEALLDVARFWLERGVDGFRLDTINFYTHDAQLRDNPALAPPEERTSATAPPDVNPYGYQRHLYDKNRPETLDFLRKLRAEMQPWNAAAVGEVGGDEQRGLEIMGEYTAGDDLMQMCYAFELLSGDRPGGADRIAQIMARVAEVAADGWACWAYSNHDVQRHASRWDLSGGASARAFTTLMMCLRGSACIYQARNWACPRPMSPLTICKILMALNSGPSSRAAMAVARRWSGNSRTSTAALPAPTSPGCRCSRNTWPTPQAWPRMTPPTRSSTTTATPSPCAARSPRWPRARWRTWA